MMSVLQTTLGTCDAAATWVTREWDVSMIRTGKLGIAKEDGPDGTWMVKDVFPDGSLPQFNKSNPDLEVRKWDLISKINGQAPTNDIVSNIADGSTMVLTIRGKRAPEPKEWEISLKKKGKLGFNFTEKAGMWEVTELYSDSTLSCFNSSNPSSAVYKGDVIVKVNGVTPTREVIQGIADGSTLTLLLRTFREVAPPQEAMI
jgi:hypothetical protein